MKTEFRKQVSDFMTPDPTTISSNHSVHEAFALMDERGLRHLPVMTDHILVGVISDRDIAFALAGNPGKLISVEEAMTPAPYTVTSDTEIGAVLRVMANNKLGCVIIKERGERVAGIFTTTDAVQLLAEVLYPN